MSIGQFAYRGGASCSRASSALGVGRSVDTDLSPRIGLEEERVAWLWRGSVPRAPPPTSHPTEARGRSICC